MGTLSSATIRHACPIRGFSRGLCLAPPGPPAAIPPPVSPAPPQRNGLLPHLAPPQQWGDLGFGPACLSCLVLLVLTGTLLFSPVHSHPAENTPARSSGPGLVNSSTEI